MPPRPPRKPSSRYGIAEWYGRDIRTLTPEERQTFGVAACNHEDGAEIDAPQCPFLSKLIPAAKCNKAGGVCSIRKFDVAEDGVTGVAVPGELVVTTCPLRFVDNFSDGKFLISSISQQMLDVAHPTIVKETPFLRTVSDGGSVAEGEAAPDEGTEDEGKKAGRIDWIIVDPASMAEAELRWAAVETQAIYFSGGRMRDEFNAYASKPSAILFPLNKRRPDYRSSGPKRLAPQLDVKVPVLRNWGKKVCVVVDRFFADNMNQMVDAYPRAKDDRERRDNAEVIWFIVDYDEELRLKPDGTIYTTLDSTRKALNASEPLSKGQFTAHLKLVIEDAARKNKVFKTAPVAAIPPDTGSPTASSP
jgi:hypothetical protein